MPRLLLRHIINSSSRPTHRHGLFCHCIVESLQRLTLGFKDTERESPSGTATPSYFLTLPNTEEENPASWKGKAAGEAVPSGPSRQLENNPTERAARIKAFLLMGTDTCYLVQRRKKCHKEWSGFASGALLSPCCPLTFLQPQGKENSSTFLIQGQQKKQNRNLTTSIYFVLLSVIYIEWIFLQSNY